MQVYVANGTLQHRHIVYRVVEGRSERTLQVSAGQQAQFPEDFTDDQLANLIPQIEQAGAVRVEDIKHLTSAYGLVYSVGKKPLTADQINALVERDVDVRQAISDAKVEAAGLAAFEGGRRQIVNNQGDPTKLNATHLEITQLQDTEREEAAKGGVDSRVTVSKNAPTGPAKRTRGK